MIDRLGLGNLILFITTWITNKFGGLSNVILSIGDSEFVKNWTDLMFIVSATCAATYGVLKVIGWFKKSRK